MELKGEFLPRAHSRRLGQLDASNWKSLESRGNIKRVDPAIREVVLLLNDKRYTTFSSCSGGHSANPRKRIDRHENGYLAFSPPSRVAFTLYLALRRKNRNFWFEAQAVIDNGDGEGTRIETVCTRLYWQLLDQKPARPEYYRKLFAEMKEIIQPLPPNRERYEEVLNGLLGKQGLSLGSRVVKTQMRRFDDY